MTKDEMTTLLRSVGVSENTVTAMENAYEMGFEQGAVAYKHLRSAVEAGRDVCKYLEANETDAALGHVRFFWDALDSIRVMEWEREE
jgi:hypothetical protein